MELVQDLFMVTGSRYWNDEFLLFNKLLEHCESYDTMMNGACPTGADHISYLMWKTLWGFPVELFPADWGKYGRKAAFLRNSAMVERKPKFCLAFLLNGYENKGTNMTINLAEKAGIPVIKTWGDKIIN
jgi:hypothetical protein